MANALQQNFQQLRNRLRASPVGAFFRWWLGELKQAMPESWQARLQHAMRRVTLTLEGDSLAVGADENRLDNRLGQLQLQGDLGLNEVEGKWFASFRFTVRRYFGM